MRDSLRTLTISAALALAAALAPVLAQTGNAPAQDSGAAATPAAPPDASKDSSGTAPPQGTPAASQDPNAPRFAAPNGADESISSDAAIPAADLKKAISILRRATRDYMQCTSTRICLTYFDSYGVGFTFADGTLAAFSHQQRGQISGHDCVVNARNALGRGDRSMAVQWMMAAQNDILNRNWISDHPDALLKALRTFNGWG